MQIVEEEEQSEVKNLQISEEDSIAKDLQAADEDAEIKSLTAEDSGSYLGIDDVKMSLVYSSVLSVPVSFWSNFSHSLEVFHMAHL